MQYATLPRTEARPSAYAPPFDADLCLGPDCRTLVLIGTGWDGYCDACTDLLIVHVTHAEAPRDDCPACTDDLGW